MSVGTYLKRCTESLGHHQTVRLFAEGLESGKIQKSQLHIRDLAESLIGPNWHKALKGRYHVGLRESIDAVDSSTFADITGQLLVSEIKQQYQAADFVLSNLVDQDQITNGNLGPQKVPWLGLISSEPKLVQQGMDYPHAGFPEQWITYPAPQKYGLICAITFEMVFSDLTKQVFDSAGSVGLRIGIMKEELIAATMFGQTVTIGGQSYNGNSHSWNDTIFNTFLTSGSWVNDISGKTITDWQDLNDLEQKFVDMKDPVTGKVIRVKPTAAVVQPYRWYNWKRALTATNTRTGPYAQSGAAPQIEAGNPLEVEYPIYKSPYAYQLLLSAGLTATQAKEYALLGDFKRAFAWRYVYDLQTAEAPPMNPSEFNQDIVYMVKSGIYGVPVVKDPRYVVRSYAT